MNKEGFIMNEKEIMYGFVNAPSEKKINKPWISFTGDRVISTNGVVMLSSAKIELINGYNKWSSMTHSEPFANFIFGSISDDNYCSMSEEFYTIIENSAPLAEKKDGVDAPKITTIETSFLGNAIKFDVWQMAPIYNACIFWDKGFFMAHARKNKCLMFKHITKDIEMAIKLI